MIPLEYIGTPLYLEYIEEIWSSFTQNSSIPRSAAFWLSMATTCKWLQCSFIILSSMLTERKQDCLITFVQYHKRFWCFGTVKWTGSEYRIRCQCFPVMGNESLVSSDLTARTPVVSSIGVALLATCEIRLMSLTGFWDDKDTLNRIRLLHKYDNELSRLDSNQCAFYIVFFLYLISPFQ